MIAELVDQLLIVTYNAWRDPKTPPLKAKPYRYPRPLPTPRRRGSTPEEIRRFFRGK